MSLQESPQGQRAIQYRTAVCVIATSLLLISCGSHQLPGPALTITAQGSGITVQISTDGRFSVHAPSQAIDVTGTVGVAVSEISVQAGSDLVGPYQSVQFSYAFSSRRRGEIRLYSDKPLLLFTETYLETGTNSNAFPVFFGMDPQFFHLTFNSQFGRPSFSELPPDGPWIFFDQQFHTAIFSAGSDFLTTNTQMLPDGSISLATAPEISELPKGFGRSAILTLGNGINATIDGWGRFVTDLQGKQRPANDADRILKYLGYWTDNGATYYYHTDPSLDYQQTLLAVRDDFARKAVPLGYMQLDSWFYPKGPSHDWQDRADGISEYIAAPALFPSGLSAFQQQLGLPLATHSRWIDPSSPYHQQFQMSGNVVIDPAYWNMIAAQLHADGVIAYEQDWLDGPAQTALNLTDPDAFLDHMSSSMKAEGLSIQYCLPRARDFMQSAHYPNVTSIRTSGDRFDRTRWDDFIYGSRLASALGLWPWSDVVMSNERSNLLVSVLSAGPVGVGDPIGAASAPNLLQAVRSDGVIVKPDVPLTPLDQTILNDASGLQNPMIASTFSAFGDLKPVYVFAYPRGAETSIAFRPSSMGLSGSVFLYRVDTGTGAELDAQNLFTDVISGEFAYYILAPVGPSHIAFLGDAQQLVPMGKARISSLTDDGALTVSVQFAAGEGTRTLRAFASTPPGVTAARGNIVNVSYDPATHLASVVVASDVSGQAVVTFR